MPHGSLTLVTLSPSSIPWILIHDYIKKIREINIYIYIYIYKKVKKGLDSKYDVLNENA